MPILQINTINKGKISLTQIMQIVCLHLREILTVILLSSVILLGTNSHPSAATQAFKIKTEGKVVAFTALQFIPRQEL